MLICCGDCGREISDLSEHCIFCGWPTKIYHISAIISKPNIDLPKHKDIIIDKKGGIELHKSCFKIDSANAFAMVNGFRQHGTIRHTSIWVDVKERHFPALISLNRRPTKFKLSDLGRRLDTKYFKLPYKYIATSASEFFIKNDINLWRTICSNGLFDIWNPQAPYDRLAKSKSPPSRYRIHLLRIFEIDHEFKRSDVLPVNDRIDHLVVDNKKLNIVNPVLSDLEFGEIKRLLEKSVIPYYSKTTG